LVDVFVPIWVGIRSSHARYRQNTCQNTCQYVLVCIEYIPIPPLRIGHVLMHVFRYVFACINYWYVPIHTKYASNTCKIRINTDWYVSIHTRHVSIHALNTYRNTYQNTYQYGAVVLVRICTYQVSIRALHFPDVTVSSHGDRHRTDSPETGPRVTIWKNDMKGYPGISRDNPTWCLSRDNPG